MKQRTKKGLLHFFISWVVIVMLLCLGCGSVIGVALIITSSDPFTVAATTLVVVSGSLALMLTMDHLKKQPVKKVS